MVLVNILCDADRQTAKMRFYVDQALLDTIDTVESGRQSDILPLCRGRWWNSQRFQVIHPLGGILIEACHAIVPFAIIALWELTPTADLALSAASAGLV